MCVEPDEVAEIVNYFLVEHRAWHPSHKYTVLTNYQAIWKSAIMAMVPSDEQAAQVGPRHLDCIHVLA